MQLSSAYFGYIGFLCISSVDTIHFLWYNIGIRVHPPYIYKLSCSRRNTKTGKEYYMGLTLAEKILKAHVVDGDFVKGQEIGLKIDQTLTQDATGTMAYIEFEAMGIDQVRTERSVAYVDHNTLQNGVENADDHRFIGSVAKKHGI